MELGGQDNQIGMTNSLGYNTNSSTKVSSTQLNSAVGETRRDQTTIHGDIIFDSPQTLDQPLYHSQQLNPQQNIPNKPVGNPDTIPDPVPASVVITSATGTEVTNRSRQRSPATAQRRAQATATATSTTIIAVPLIRYRECLKNHAASMGSHVIDGCGEFMPSGEEGTVEALKCAACECHRSFHRKEIDGESQYAANSHYTYNTPNRNSNQRNTVPHHHHHQIQQQQASLHQQHHRISYTGPLTAPIAPMMMTFGARGSSGGVDESSSEDLNMFQSSAGAQMSVQPRKKRFRTKFSQEQKDKMLEFAEKLGWRIQKQDEQEVQQFCAEVGVKRQVFKVWMHNNKQALKKKEE